MSMFDDIEVEIRVPHRIFHRYEGQHPPGHEAPAPRSDGWYFAGWYKRGWHDWKHVYRWRPLEWD